MAERFLRATALSGCLYLMDFTNWEPWQPNKIQYRDLAEVQWRVRASRGVHRLIRTVAELLAAIDDSTACAVHLYVHADLLDDTRRCWEERRQTPSLEPRGNIYGDTGA